MGIVSDKVGTCTDTAQNSYYEGTDACLGFAWLDERYCYQCEEDICDPRYLTCEFGCKGNRCQTKSQLLNNMVLPTSGVWCIDGDTTRTNQNPMPLIPVASPEDANNGRTDFTTQSYCIDHGNREKVYIDSCDGESNTGTLLYDYYCTDRGYCEKAPKRCLAGCKNGQCNPIPQQSGFCLNPGSDLFCKNTYNNICCPAGNGNYPVNNGPLNYENCNMNYFLTRALSSIDLQRCPNAAITGFCTNPASDMCTQSTSDVCCPIDEENYPVWAGPSSRENCIKEYFNTKPDQEVDKSKCTLTCCCEVYYDVEDTKQYDIRTEYALACNGDYMYPLSNSDCTIENCQSVPLFEGLPPIIIGDNNWLSNILEGRECKKGKGTCKNGLFCLSDLNIAEKEICCKENDCPNKGVCVPENTKSINENDNREYVCVGSKWNAVDDYAGQLVIDSNGCEKNNGKCRGGFLSFRKTTEFLRNGNFCNKNERDYASCGNIGFLGVEKRCCVPLAASDS